jgi:hypothetical protein
MWGIYDGLAIVRRNERRGDNSYDDDEERDTRGMDSKPDAVTYNTVLVFTVVQSPPAFYVATTRNSKVFGS